MCRPPSGRGLLGPWVPWIAVLLMVGMAAPSAGGARQIGGREPGGGESMECDVPSHQGFTSVTLSNGDQVMSFSRPVFRCSEGTRITTDSARVYNSTQYYQLFGHVVFQDAESRLTAEQAQYFGTERRLRAWGTPVLTNATDGSVIQGDTMVLLRAGEGRPEDQLTVTGRRPHATLYPARRQEEPASPHPPGELPDTGNAGPPPLVPDTVAGGPPLLPPDTLAVGVPVPLPPPAVPEASPPPSEATPYDIDASRIVLEGSRYFRATGSVVLTRDSLTAAADSVEYDQSMGTLSLSREARVETATYDLSAETIVLVIPQDDVREVLARRDAVLEGEDLELQAPIISLFLEEGKLQRLVAFRDVEADSLTEEGGAGSPSRTLPNPSRPGVLRAGASPREREAPAGASGPDSTVWAPPSRPQAVAENFSLTADSLEVLSPDEELDRVRAMGRARGESLGRDSLNTPDTPPIIRRDWLEGDTVVATFVRPGDTLPTLEDSVAALGDSIPAREVPLRMMVAPEPSPDSAQGGYELRRLVAQGNARSLYRLAPSDSTLAEEGGPPAAHYVVGDEITILLKDGEVESMEVKGQTLGIHLEPAETRRSGGGGG